MTVAKPGSVDSISVSRHKRAPRRPLSQLELATLTRIANTLIPAKGENPAGAGVENFSALAHQALGILDKYFDRVVGLLEYFARIDDGGLWGELKSISGSRPDDFYWLSTVIVGAYLYSPELKALVGYPAPHPNPAGMFDIAEELESGILDPVIDRGSVYTRLRQG